MENAPEPAEKSRGALLPQNGKRESLGAAVLNFARAKAGIILGVAIVVALMSGIAGADLMGWLFPDMILHPINFWTPTNGMSGVAPPDYGWILTSYIAILLMCLIGAIGYMMAGGWGPKVKAWCKNVLIESVKSAILLTLCAALFVGVENLPVKSLPFAGFVQIDSAIDFAELVRNTIIYEFANLTAITAIMSMLGNITPYLRPAGVIGISFSLAPAFRPIFDSLGIMLSSLAVAVGTWFVQLWFLMLVKTRLLAVFMPVGLFLRSFGYMRPGNVLIAVAIGFYFVFPFVLNLNALALNNYLEASFATGDIYQVSDSQAAYYGDYSSCTDHARGSSADCFYRLMMQGPLKYFKGAIKSMGWAGLAVFAVLNLFTGTLVGSVFFSFLLIYTLSIMATTMFYVIVVSILMPLFNIFITLTVIKELAKYLGSEIDLSAFEKIF